MLTEWQPYRHPDFDRIRSLLNEPVIFDGRNLYEPNKMQERGFAYVSIGRPAVFPAHEEAAGAAAGA